MAEEIQHKGFGSVHFKAIDEDGTVEAIVSVFGVVDSYKERTMPGAFKESLSRGLPKGVWMHDWEKPICKTVEARELEPGDPLLPESLQLLGGLYVKGQFHKDITDSWQAYLKIKAGYVDEYSFGYRVLADARDEETGVRDLTKVDLFEWSPVLVGAVRSTTTLSVKADLRDGPVGMSLEDHTDLLVERWEKHLEARKTKGDLNDAFVNRLGEASAKLADLAANARNAAAPQATTKGALEWELLTHKQRLRDQKELSHQ